MPPDPVNTEKRWTIYVCECGMWDRWHNQAAHAETCGRPSEQVEVIPASSVAELRRALETIRDGTAPPATTERESMDTPALPRATIHKLAASALHPEPTEESDGR